MPKENNAPQVERADVDSFKLRFSQLVAEYRAPKEQVNEFGKYKYRSAEQMIDTLKPLAIKYGILFTASSHIVGGDAAGAPGRVYVEARVTAEDVFSDECRSAAAYARETLAKKGMDDAQVSGAALSYALKYALGLLLMVGTEADPDASEPQQTRPQVASEALDAYRDAFKECKRRMGLEVTALQTAVEAQFGRAIGPDSDVKTLQDATAWLQTQGMAE